MTKFINYITNFLGLALIPVGAYSVFVLDKVNWQEFMFVIFAAMILIYIKNNRATKIMEKIINKFIDQKYGAKNKSL